MTIAEEGGAITNTVGRKELLGTKWVGPEAEYSIDEVMGDPEIMANIAPANKLGNGPPSSGDGWEYRGRGPLQLTWKGVYDNFTNVYQNNGYGSTSFVENNGKISSDVEKGTLAAIWYWNKRVLTKSFVDEGSLTVEDVTEAINPGMKGIEQREKVFGAIENNVDCDK